MHVQRQKHVSVLLDSASVLDGITCLMVNNKAGQILALKLKYAGKYRYIPEVRKVAVYWGSGEMERNRKPVTAGD